MKNVKIFIDKLGRHEQGAVDEEGEHSLRYRVSVEDPTAQVRVNAVRWVITRKKATQLAQNLRSGMQIGAYISKTNLSVEVTDRTDSGSIDSDGEFTAFAGAEMTS